MIYAKKSRVKILAVLILQLIFASIILFGASCSSTTQKANAQPMVYSSGTVPIRGIVTQYTSSNISLDTGVGRIFLLYDNNTAAVRINRLDGAVNVNDFKSGMEILVYYYPTSNLATDIEFLPLPLAIPAIGSIAQITNPIILLNTGAGNIALRLIGGLIIIKKDGSTGTTNDLTPGTNIRVFYYPRTNTVIVAELQ